MRNDLLDVFQKTIEDAGLRNVFPTAPDAHKYPESISFSMGVPDKPTSYFDFNQNVSVRITCYVRGIGEAATRDNAVVAESAVRRATLDSANGSYRIIKKETTRPAALPWDQSARFIYFFETTIEYKEV